MALRFNSVNLLILMGAIPLFAHLSDRVGRKAVIVPSAIAIIVLAYPLFWMMHHHNETYIITGGALLALLSAAYMSPIPATLTELFSASVRVSAVSIGYNLAFAIFGGTIPIIAVWLIRKEQDDLAFVWYIVAAGVISLVVALGLRRGRHRGQLPS
jgi:MHS family proline/betaine transporter-like MFS transporter